MKFISLLLLFVTAVAFTVSPSFGLAGGQRSQLTKHSSIISLWTYNDTYCSGFLIGDVWVLTTLECTWTNGNYVHGVRVGSPSPFKRGEFISVIQQEGYYPFETIGNYIAGDLALLKLKYPVPRDVAKPIGFPKFQEPIEAGTNVTILGFGWTDEDVYGALRELTVPVQDPIACVQAFGMNEWHYAFACAGNMRRDVIAGTCPGDGGAPVEYNGKAVGFINTIKGDACDVTAGQPIFFHKLSEYTDWIQNVTGIDPS